jgi:hypothetical protein
MPLLTGKWIYQNDRLQPLVFTCVPEMVLMRKENGRETKALAETQLCYL